MPEAVIVATARTPIGRANKGSLVDCRPDDLSALDHRRGARQGPAARPRARSRTSSGAAASPPAKPGTNVGRVAGDPRRRRRAGRHRQPLLLVVAADDPHGRARDQGRRGRRVHRRRRRDREPLPVRRGRHRSAQREVRRGARPHQGARRGRPAAVDAADRPPRRLHRDGPDRGERASRPKASTREEMDEFAARSQQRAVAAQENGFFEREITPVTLARRHGRDEGRRPARRHDGREARDAASRCSVPTAR